MKLLIISGTSGSGKSTVLHVLEDLGYFCIDNLPIGLLSNLAAHMVGAGEDVYTHAAIGIDARSRGEELARFPAILEGLRKSDLDTQVVFIDADDSILLKRFSETRRKHPLTSDNRPLSEAIDHERGLLEPISINADLYLDSSHSNIYELRDMVRQRVAQKGEQDLSIQFLSFGFKHGSPKDADLMFDVRCLPNPYWEPHLREYTGQQQPVIEYLERQPLVNEMLEDLKTYLSRWIPRFRDADRSYLTVAIGCTGGQHRSVYLVDRLAASFTDYGDVITRHRELS